MPECQNCGHHVTANYERVATARDEDGVEVCPFCPDRVRDGGRVREIHASRTSAHGVEAGDATVPPKESDD